MLFTEIKPFVRYVQKSTCSPVNNRYVCPCDNRLFFCVNGNGLIETEQGYYKMQKGCLLLLAAGIKYKLIPSNEPTEYISVNFDYTFNASSIAYPVLPVPVDYFEEKHLLNKVFFDEHAELNSILYLQDMHMITTKLESLLSAYLIKMIYYETELSGILTKILVECLRFNQITIPRQHNMLNAILQYISEHCDQHLSNQEIAKHFGYNKNYISELVKMTTGLPLHKYILNVRVNRAIELLENSEKSISEVADACGFYDLYHFSKVFKATTGVAPSKYRKT